MINNSFFPLGVNHDKLSVLSMDFQPDHPQLGQNFQTIFKFNLS